MPQANDQWVLTLMMDNLLEDWGQPFYPVVE
ncbi:hypothetical protein THPR109532_20200 [Thalassospira profundimaris]|jgi:hypothetical protein